MTVILTCIASFDYSPRRFLSLFDLGRDQVFSVTTGRGLDLLLSLAVADGTSEGKDSPRSVLNSHAPYNPKTPKNYPAIPCATHNPVFAVSNRLTPATRLAILAVLTLLGAQLAAADWVEPRTARDVPGTRHGTYLLRVVNYEGVPVETMVTLAERATAFSSRELTLAMAKTSADGRIEFKDISSRHPLVLRTEGPDGLRPSYQLLPEVVDGTVDLGTLSLQQNFVVTGVIYEHDAKGERRKVDASIALVDADTTHAFTWNRTVESPGEFRFEEFDDRPMSIKINLYAAEGTRTYNVPFALDPARPHRHLLLTLPRDNLLREVVVEETEWLQPAESPKHTAGQVVDESGEPLAGIRVEGHVHADRRVRVILTETDEQGRFRMATGNVLDGWLVVPALTGGLWFELDTLSFVVPTSGKFYPGVRGERSDRVAYSWLHRDEWLPVDPEELYGGSNRGAPALLRAQVPGRIDRLDAYPPAGGRAVFDYRTDKFHGLRIVGGGAPVAGAIVQVVDALPPLALEAHWYIPRSGLHLNRVTTGADGRLNLAGAPNAIYVAYVYAPGYEPAHTRLVADKETVLDLVPRSAQVRFSGLGQGESLRVKVAHRDSLVARHSTDTNEPIDLKLAPGSYDLTVEDQDGAILRGRTVRVSAGAQGIDMGRDERPQVVVRSPDAQAHLDWIVSATRGTPRGGTVGRWERENPSPILPGDATIAADSLDATTRRLSLPGGGRWLIHANAGRELRHALFTEVELEAGERRVLELPRLDASLAGRVTYTSDTPGDYHIHGFAHPRMMLLRAPGTGHGWNVVAGVVASPLRSEEKARPFELDQLPAGNYHLFHHLADGDAWGGIEVSLEEGSRTDIGDLDAHETGYWTVQVVRGNGRPVSDAVLRIRDRMYEAWSAFRTYENSDAIFADNPIPRPPAGRLRDGRVTFDKIRPGWLEFELAHPAGPVRHYLRKVEPGRTLRLVLDE